MKVTFLLKSVNINRIYIGILYAFYFVILSYFFLRYFSFCLSIKDWAGIVAESCNRALGGRHDELYLRKILLFIFHRWLVFILKPTGYTCEM